MIAWATGAVMEMRTDGGYDPPVPTGKPLFHLIGEHLHIEVVAPRLDLAIGRGLEDAGHRQRHPLALDLERIDALVHDDVTDRRAMQHLELEPGGALQQSLDRLANRGFALCF